MAAVYDDVWGLIIEFLPLSDQIMMTQVSRQVRDMARRCIKSRFKKQKMEALCNTSNIFRDFELDENAILLSVIAPLLKDIMLVRRMANANLSDALVPIFLNNHYPNLNALSINVNFLTDRDMALIARNCPALTELMIKDCTEVTGAHLKELLKLRKLCLIHCSLSPEHLDEILDGRMKELEYLDLRGYYVIQPPLERLLSALLRMQLTHLAISILMLSEPFVNALKHMHNLKTLRWESSPNGPITPEDLISWSSFYQFFGSKIVEITCHNYKEQYFIDSFGTNPPPLSALKYFSLVGYVHANPVQRLHGILQNSQLEQFYLSDEESDYQRVNRRIEASEWLPLIKSSANLKLLSIKTKLHVLSSIVELVHGAIHHLILHPRPEPLNIHVIDSNPRDPIIADVTRRLRQDVQYRHQDLVRVAVSHEHHCHISTLSFLKFNFSN